MKNFLKKAVLLSFFCCSFMEAREEVILTIPKSGTHYLKLIIENITGQKNFPQKMSDLHPEYYELAYAKFKSDPHSIVFGHCEPAILRCLPKDPSKLLLVRDPRDVVLSAIDFIDLKGVQVWPNLHKKVTQQKYDTLTKKQKILLILDDSHFERDFSITSLFESAINVCNQGHCLIIKYEDLSPTNKSPKELSQTVLQISHFLKKDLSPAEVERVIQRSFKNHTSPTLNKGSTHRYTKELDNELLKLLNSKLQKQIDFFGYNL